MTSENDRGLHGWRPGKPQNQHNHVRQGRLNIKPKEGKQEQQPHDHRADVIPFPRPYRYPLPADAIPRGKLRHVLVFPWRGAWSWLEMDESGGGGDDNLSKEQAINEALSYVFECAATLEISNDDPSESGW